ncbi:MAG: hypothetical protein KAT58_02735 [candidate division Zixibacteria bacterium]|nr:hypothetical protein [candidate division Zixibacteria bacterium]
MTDKRRHAITSFFHEGQTLVRAHFWDAKGYSTKTFNTAREASGWITQKENMK